MKGDYWNNPIFTQVSKKFCIIFIHANLFDQMTKAVQAMEIPAVFGNIIMVDVPIQCTLLYFM